MDKLINILPNEPIKISVNIEGLVDYVMSKANEQYSNDFPISQIEEWIRDFFK
jgi:hypothetical protein